MPEFVKTVLFCNMLIKLNYYEAMVNLRENLETGIHDMACLPRYLAVGFGGMLHSDHFLP